MLLFSYEYRFLLFNLIKIKLVLVDNDMCNKSMNYINDSWLFILDILVLNLLFYF